MSPALRRSRGSAPCDAVGPAAAAAIFRGNSRSESAPMSENSWRFGAVLTPSGPRELGQPLGGAGCPVLPAGHTEPPQIASESRILATFCASLSARKRRWPIDPFARRGDRSRPQGTNCNVSLRGQNSGVPGALATNPARSSTSRTVARQLAWSRAPPRPHWLPAKPNRA